MTITDNSNILDPPKNWQIYCKKCDYFINFLNTALWRVERTLEFYESIPTAPVVACKHDLDIREYER